MKTELQRNKKRTGGAAALNKLMALGAPEPRYNYPIKAPDILPGVVGKGSTAAVLATDYQPGFNPYSEGNFGAAGIQLMAGFPGYPYLSMLTTRAEYRAFASAISTESTREWIKFTSKQDDADDTNDKIKVIEEEFERYKVRDIFKRAVEHDCYFGRAQIFIDIDGADKNLPLILDPRTIKKGSLKSFSTVEAIWTTPVAYNASDPSAADFYKPNGWWMLGQHVHASRLMTIVTRELPDMLKPAFNFSGMSLSQLAEPYVDNWIRTRQSVADLINNFSITAIATSMDEVLQGTDDGSALFKRAALFTLTRRNKGLMLLDKDREELVQVNVPLSGLSELQAQSQEHMCSVSRTPAIVLTGISPTGLNASSEGEIRVFYDWIAAGQNSHWREPLDTILKVIQLNKFGEIDPDIGFDFVPLYQMTEKELAEIRKSDGDSAVAYVGANILAPEEVREKLAKDPNSGYMGLDTSKLPPPPPEPTGEEPPDGMEDDKPKPKPAQDSARRTRRKNK